MKIQHHILGNLCKCTGETRFSTGNTSTQCFKQQEEEESWNSKSKTKEEIHGWSERAEIKLVGVKGGNRGQSYMEGTAGRSLSICGELCIVNTKKK